MTHSCKISIIIPVYNAEVYIERCLESVVSQTIYPKEVLIVDDGSTDDTPDIVHQYMGDYEFIKLFSQNRQGAGSARNRAIKEAIGEYIAFMDADDYYFSDEALERLYNGAIINKVRCAGGKFIAKKEDRFVNGGMNAVDATAFEEDGVIEYCNYQSFVGYQAFIYNTQMVLCNKIFFPDYSRVQDPIFMIKAMNEAKYIWVTTKGVYVYRVVDKKIDLYSSIVIHGIIDAFSEIVEFAEMNHYFKMAENALNSLCKYSDYLMFHVYKGDLLLYKKMKALYNIITQVSDPDSVKFLDYSLQTINAYVDKLIDYEKKLLRKMESFGDVVIYGAGSYGKHLYDLIINDNKIRFKGFAISAFSTNPMETARGGEIKCISEYKGREEATLVVIASSNHSGEMEKKAMELGFRNRLIVNRKIVDVVYSHINNKEHAVQ